MIRGRLLSILVTPSGVIGYRGEGESGRVDVLFSYFNSRIWQCRVDFDGHTDPNEQWST